MMSWHQTQWDYLLKRRQNNNLPHALLLSGVTGLGKQLFARNFSKLLLCHQAIKADQPCGVCRSCELIAADSHPDFYQLQPEAAGKNIRIDQIRELINQLQQTVHQGSYKVVLIEPAEALQTAAVNALLKTLEEPSANTLLILISNQAGLLPATIRSRCQMVHFHPPNNIVAKEWLLKQLPSEGDADLLLALAEGAPLRALNLVQNLELYQRLTNDLGNISQNKNDPIQIAAGWMKEPLSEIINCLIQTTMDIIRLKSGLPLATVTFKNKIAFLQSLAQTINVVKLFAYLDRLYQLRQPLNAIANLNQQLLLEDLFGTWHEYTNTTH
jgi:DNA polymerase-3 subunit delta'